ncbi:TetR/AcrR family transcriptional regulator [Actinomadura nitritigenes]|uniref:TetR/AcrR family transcriptional regulator n=1 Tax=Actinomadura nitritigenes TaxID=134602 RepID=A0ABS3R956_9ACTN|nr:TetR/AcrR family transcriptional regulator [Actinomadura nitritigenes]MBO2442769.1 TetR/AcrR family transcriptional regulator [Actinomadura nitritigenes]
MTEAPSRRADTRARIIDAAARLLQDHGPAAVTTRGVAEAAGVQAPAIYRLFGDKDGLLEAVAEHVMATYVSAKAEIVRAAAAEEADPLDDLRSGWLMQIDFGVANPALFRLFSDPDRVLHSPAARSGRRVLESRVHRVAESGRLRVSERRAVDLIQAAGIGTIQTLLATPPEQRDAALAESMYEAVLRQILTDAPDGTAGGSTATAVAFRAIAPGLTALTEGERRLLTEWLDRVIAGG